MEKQNTIQVSAKSNETQIAARAYQFWETDGRRHGEALKYWLQAEAELCVPSAASGPKHPSAKTNFAPQPVKRNSGFAASQPSAKAKNKR
jgi:hypothetical protein